MSINNNPNQLSLTLNYGEEIQHIAGSSLCHRHADKLATVVNDYVHKLLQTEAFTDARTELNLTAESEVSINFTAKGFRIVYNNNQVSQEFQDKQVARDISRPLIEKSNEIYQKCMRHCQHHASVTNLAEPRPLKSSQEFLPSFGERLPYIELEDFEEVTKRNSPPSSPMRGEISAVTTLLQNPIPLNSSKKTPEDWTEIDNLLEAFFTPPSRMETEELSSPKHQVGFLAPKDSSGKDLIFESKHIKASPQKNRSEEENLDDAAKKVDDALSRLQEIAKITLDI